MILPTKHLEPDKSLFAIGGSILASLLRPRTVTSVWEAVQKERKVLTFEHFALALAFLHTIGAIELEDDLLRRARR
ncbi:MAG TPA: ABC-three component system middle component 6 [Bryobacteraceae bacterium]|nr:ABC-three component system middle component 6 [Bryobacteraceae bacterium]